VKIIKPDQACVLTINGDSSRIEFALYQEANRWSEGFMEG